MVMPERTVRWRARLSAGFHLPRRRRSAVSGGTVDHRAARVLPAFQRQQRRPTSAAIRDITAPPRTIWFGWVVK